MNRDKLDLFIKNEVCANCTSPLHGLQHFKRVEANGLPGVMSSYNTIFSILKPSERNGCLAAKSGTRFLP